VILALEDSLEETMSQYLVERLRRIPNLEVRTNTTVASAEGNNRLEELTLENVKTGRMERVRCDGLFVFIGATPRTEWLGNTVRRDEKGFILSGAELKCDVAQQWAEWPFAARALSVGNEHARRICRWGCAERISQTADLRRG
jgi:thioredoxin reductase (NADPH)